MQAVAALELSASASRSLAGLWWTLLSGSRRKNMKEPRPGSSGRSELRVLFAFDPKRQAILLVAGDKAGSWSKWYVKNIPIADDLFDDHLKTLKGDV
ncbi:type II toxin-antitoxin system RelE/ParE family toxin [Arthrobacter psychrolactophilus]